MGRCTAELWPERCLPRDGPRGVAVTLWQAVGQGWRYQDRGGTLPPFEKLKCQREEDRWPSILVGESRAAPKGFPHVFAGHTPPGPPLVTQWSSSFRGFSSPQSCNVAGPRTLSSPSPNLLHLQTPTLVPVCKVPSAQLLRPGVLQSAQPPVPYTCFWPLGVLLLAFLPQYTWDHLLFTATAGPKPTPSLHLCHWSPILTQQQTWSVLPPGALALHLLQHRPDSMGAPGWPPRGTASPLHDPLESQVLSSLCLELHP